MSEPEILTVPQVAEALQVTAWTVRRLIKCGDLPGFKVGKDWRVRRIDLEKFISQRLTSSGPYAVKPYFYRLAVLDKYRADQKKYYLHDAAFSGKLGSREDLGELFQRRGVGYNPYLLTRPLFCEVHYQKVRLKDGTLVVVLKPQEDAKIIAVAEEQDHWLQFLIRNPEFK